MAMIYLQIITETCVDLFTAKERLLARVECPWRGNNLNVILPGRHRRCHL